MGFLKVRMIQLLTMLCYTVVHLVVWVGLEVYLWYAYICHYIVGGEVLICISELNLFLEVYCNFESGPKKYLERDLIKWQLWYRICKGITRNYAKIAS